MAAQKTWTLAKKFVKLGTGGTATLDVSCQAISAMFTEAPQYRPVVDTACADGYDRYISSKRSFDLTFYADWDDANGICWFLHDHHNQDGIAAIYSNGAGAGPSETAPITILGVGIGGPAGDFTQLTISLPVTAPPTFSKT